jgi:hypothetical protein
MVYSCVMEQLCVCVFIHMEIRGRYWLCPALLFSFLCFWDRVSHWTQPVAWIPSSLNLDQGQTLDAGSALSPTTSRGSLTPRCSNMPRIIGESPTLAPTPRVSQSPRIQWRTNPCPASGTNSFWSEPVPGTDLGVQALHPLFFFLSIFY